MPVADLAYGVSGGQTDTTEYIWYSTCMYMYVIVPIWGVSEYFPSKNSRHLEIDFGAFCLRTNTTSYYL